MKTLLTVLSSPNVLSRMSCTQDEKEEIMDTIRLLCEMTETSRQTGYAVLMNKYADRIDNDFFRCALALLTDTGSSDLMLECCLPYLLTSDLSGKAFAERFITLVGLYKLIQGETAECIEIILKSYLGILCTEKILE